MKFQEYIEELHEKTEMEFRRVDEAGLHRVIQTLRGNVEFGIISGFRKFDKNGNKIELKENQKRNNNLLRDLRNILGNNKAYGSFRLIGHWKECSVEIPKGKKLSDCELLGGNIHNVLEETWCIINDQKNPKFFEALVKVSDKYSQDCFVYKGNEKFGLFYSDGEQFDTFKKIDDKTLKRGLEAVMDVQGYSENRNTRQRGRLENIIFTSTNESFECFLTVPEGNIASHQFYKSMNLLWK
jgi:hypothetical protein